MFRKSRVNVIESDEGYSVEVLGMVALLYVEGSRSIHINSEVSTETEIALFKDSISTWDPPYDNEIINDDERNAIIEKIRRAFRSQGKVISVF